MQYRSCADPESFVRGGPTLKTFFRGERGSKLNKYHYKRAIIDPRAKRHLNGVSLACRWWPNIECWLGSYVIFRGSRPVLLRNPIFLWIFRGGGPDTLSPPMDPHLIDPVFYVFYKNILLIYAFIGSVWWDDKHRKSELMRFFNIYFILRIYADSTVSATLTHR